MNLESGKTIEEIAGELKYEQEKLLNAENVAEEARKKIAALEEKMARFGGELNFDEDINAQVAEIDKEAGIVAEEATTSISNIEDEESEKEPVTLEGFERYYREKREKCIEDFANYRKEITSKPGYQILLKEVFFDEKGVDMFFSLDHNSLNRDLGTREEYSFKKAGLVTEYDDLRNIALEFNNANSQIFILEQIKQNGVEVLDQMLSANNFWQFGAAGKAAFFLVETGKMTKDQVVALFNTKLEEYLQSRRGGSDQVAQEEREFMKNQFGLEAFL